MIKELILFLVTLMTVSAKGQDVVKAKVIEPNTQLVEPRTLINENYIRMLTKPMSRLYLLASDTLMEDAAKEIIAEKGRWTIVNERENADVILDLGYRRAGYVEYEISAKIIDPHNDDRSIYETAVIITNGERDINVQRSVFRKLYESITSI
jgi:hypothetical protein